MGGEIMDNLTFTLTQEQAQRMLIALGKEPYVNIADIINAIQQQAREQMEQNT